MLYLKQSTAVTIMFGPFVDKTDGVTLKTDATTITDIDHATTGIFLSKNGGTAAIRNQTVTASVADAYGMMKVTLDTTDTNTIGRLVVLFAKAATYLPVHKEFQVLAANIFDSLFGAATVKLQTDLTQILTTAVSTPATAGIIDVNIKNIANAVVNTATAQVGANVVSQANIDFGATQKASITAAVPTVAQIQAEMEENGASLLDTIRDQIGTAGAGLTAVPWNAAWDAEVQSECADAIAADASVAAILADTGTDGVVVAAGSKTGYALSNAGADAIWDRTGSITSLAFELLLERIYEMINNKMNITDADGTVALRNLVDGANIATGSVTDDLTTTVRAGLTWA